MTTANRPPPPKFTDWLADRLGTRQWLASRITDRMQRQGYTLAVSQKQFAALSAEYERLKADYRAERIALRLFPDDFHDGSDCRAEYGRIGEPCRICADKSERWRDRVKAVRDALEAEA